MSTFIDSLKKIPFSNTLAFITVLLSFIYFFYISSSHLPIALVKEISDIKIAIITILSTVMGFYFGGAKSKSNTTPPTP